jgi:glycosyltransferase involved in cell wall biosynthesis
MKKTDIAFVVHKREDPNSRLRIYPVAREMRKRGWRCDVRDVPKGFMGRALLFLSLARTDVILLHKKLFNRLEVLILKALKKRIIFDFDDAIMYTEARRKQPMTDKFTGRFRKIMEISDAAVAGNEFLANEAKKHCRRVEVMTTPVDVTLYTPGAPKNKKDEVVIGWIGLPGNLFYLKELAPVFQSLARRFPGVALSVVCNDFPDIEGIKINKRTWSIENELEFLREMDIGLMPLTDDIWSRGKCGFKILQYFSVGVPVVASPVGINSDIVQHGVNGFLSTTDEEWESNLAALLSDKSLREKMGAAGRKTVAEKFSLKDYLERYASLLEGIARAAGKPA